MTIVIGVGTGRCGTASLAGLLNAQPETVCFHEANPACMAWNSADATVLSLLRDFEALLQGKDRAVTVDLTSPGRANPLARLRNLDMVTAIGDVGSYYLPYVHLILRVTPEARFPCLRRDRSQTIRSFVEKVSLTKDSSGLGRTRNHWAEPDRKRWLDDAKWDKCFPKYYGMGEASLESYVEKYYDDYYLTAQKLERIYPDRFRIFDVEKLNSLSGRMEILKFCLPTSNHIDISVRLNAIN